LGYLFAGPALRRLKKVTRRKGETASRNTRRNGYTPGKKKPPSLHIELQHTDGAKNDVVAALGEEHLRRALFRQLLQALSQLLGDATML
jgi:hypothetical protein